MKDSLEELFSLEWNKEYEFYKSCGFTFAFERNIISYDDKIASAEIKPVAIIYEENDEFYLAPLDESIDIETILKKYVEDSF